MDESSVRESIVEEAEELVAESEVEPANVEAVSVREAKQQCTFWAVSVRLTVPVGETAGIGELEEMLVDRGYHCIVGEKERGTQCLEVCVTDSVYERLASEGEAVAA